MEDFCGARQDEGASTSSTFNLVSEEWNRDVKPSICTFPNKVAKRQVSKGIKDVTRYTSGQGSKRLFDKLVRSPRSSLFSLVVDGYICTAPHLLVPEGRGRMATEVC